MALRRPVARIGAALARGRALVAELADQTSLSSRRLTLGLGIALGALCLLGAREMSLAFPTGIDFEIPLRAAARWADGGQPYPPSAMQVGSGPDLPYLYPPYLLPILAPIAQLPRDIVTGLWLMICAAAAVWTCRRLAIPWLAIPCVLVWPPFIEGLVTGNVQILAFAAFAALMYEPAGGMAGARLLDERRGIARDTLNGLAAAAVGVLKVAQMLPLAFLLRRRWRAAAIGAAAVAALALLLLPLTGIGVYGDYIAQLRRASDPAWTIGGIGLGRYLGVPDTVPMVAGIVLALLLRGRDAGAWLGVALVIATPSVHGYTFLFLVPALLTMRRDLAFCIAACYLGNYNIGLWWAGCLLTVCCLAAAGRWERFRAVAAPADHRPGYNPVEHFLRSRLRPRES